MTGRNTRRSTNTHTKDALKQKTPAATAGIQLIPVVVNWSLLIASGRRCGCDGCSGSALRAVGQPSSWPRQISMDPVVAVVLVAVVVVVGIAPSTILTWRATIMSVLPSAEWSRALGCIVYTVSM